MLLRPAASSLDDKGSGLTEALCPNPRRQEVLLGVEPKPGQPLHFQTFRQLRLGDRLQYLEWLQYLQLLRAFQTWQVLQQELQFFQRLLQFLVH
mmetsp:Transcript_58920/g.105842  ORF Transcript_58920/g.105842 Transcript_58920/m.105842 type:complete len:94 (+) Transcript_58920:103-384(+)